MPQKTHCIAEDSPGLAGDFLAAFLAGDLMALLVAEPLAVEGELEAARGASSI